MYKKIVNLTFLPVFENKIALMRALLLPMVLIILLTKLPQFYDDKLVGLIVLLFIFLLNITIAITTHRILLLGTESIPKWGLFKFSSREFSFLLTTAFISLFMGFVILLGFLPMMLKLNNLVAVISVFVSILFALVLFSRFSLALPAIAIEKEISIMEAWHYTKKYKLLTFFTIILFPLIISLIVGLVYELAIGFLIKVISPHLDILFPILDVFLTVFIVSALSATYRVIKEQHPEYFKKIQKRTNEIILTSNKEQKIIDTNIYQITFESLKEELIQQYETLGFDNIVVDKENSWMIKNKDDKNAYVALSLKDNEYKIETYNVQEVELESYLMNIENIN